MTDLATLDFRLGFFKLIVRDLEGMIAFYQRTFGFEIRNRIEIEGAQEAMLALPEKAFTLILYRWTDDRAIAIGTGYGPLGFMVADTDTAYAHAVANGAREKLPPFDVEGARIAFIDDPEGHEIEIVQVVQSGEAA